MLHIYINIIKMIKSEFDTGWITGFIEGKGTFTKNTIKITRKTKKGVKFYYYVNPAFYLVSMDRSALEILKEILGMGKLSKHGSVFRLEIRRKDDLLRLANFLHPRLRSRARRPQFEAWRRMVLQWKSRAWGEGTVAPR